MGNSLLQPVTLFIGLGVLIFQGTSSATHAKPVVTFTSPCTCEGNHGVSRWAAKTDLAEPPPNNVKRITPSEIYAWPGPGQNIGHRTGRVVAENQWYAVTGRIERVRIEDDGDIHIV